MSASLIIKGADFSENGIPKYDFSGNLPVTGWTYHFTQMAGLDYTFVNLSDRSGQSMWTPKAVGVEVLLDGGTEFSIVKYDRSNGLTTELGTFSIDAGVKKVYMLDSEVALNANEYIGIKINAGAEVRFMWNATSLGQFVQVTTKTSTPSGNVPVNVVVSKNW